MFPVQHFLPFHSAQSQTIHVSQHLSGDTTQLTYRSTLISSGHPCFSVDLSNPFHSLRSEHQQSIVYWEISAMIRLMNTKGIMSTEVMSKTKMVDPYGGGRPR